MKKMLAVVLEDEDVLELCRILHRLPFLNYTHQTRQPCLADRTRQLASWRVLGYTRRERTHSIPLQPAGSSQAKADR